MAETDSATGYVVSEGFVMLSRHSSFVATTRPSVSDPATRSSSAYASQNQQQNQQQRRRSTVSGRRPTLYHDVSFHPSDGKLQLYSNPEQRQKWGDDQVLPRINYGDLFFDLFYVAMAYNSANILASDPTPTGILYFLGTFFPMMELWLDKTVYDARFVIDGDDLSHRGLESMGFLVTATGTLHIRPVSIMSNSRDNVDMFGFALTQTIIQFFSIIAYGEIYFKGLGQRDVLKWTTIREIRLRMIPFCLYLVATIYAGVQFFGHDRDDHHFEEEEEEMTDGYRVLAGGDGTSDSSYPDDEKEPPFSTHIPIWFCMAAVMFRYLQFFVTIYFLFPNDGSHKNFTVPLNIDFFIHRHGEWIMLMLGESVLSVLIADVSDGTEYYSTFFCAMLTVILLQYFHFRSQPHEADRHALRRHKDAAVWWTFFNNAYSASLVVVGFVYKAFLNEFSKGGDGDDDYYSSGNGSDYGGDDYPSGGSEYGGNATNSTYGGGSYNTNTTTDDYGDRRFLAGGGGGAVDDFSTEERQQRLAHFFCGAMALVFFCSDAMILLHMGLKEGMDRCQNRRRSCDEKVLPSSTSSPWHDDNGNGGLAMKGIVVIFLRGAVVIFMATVSQWETSPQRLAGIGLGVIVTQLVLRRMGGAYFPQHEEVHSSLHVSSSPPEHGVNHNHKDDDDGKDDDDDDNRYHKRKSATRVVTDPEENKWPNVTHAVALPQDGNDQ